MEKTKPQASEPTRDFSRSYEDHFPLVYRFGFRLLGNSEQALDLSQEVFLKLHRALKDGREVLDIQGWLYRAAANLACDWLRRKRRYSEILHSGIDAGDARQDVEGEFIKSEETRVIRASLERLSPRDRVLLTLYAEGLPYQEIAGAAGVARNSVGKQISRAIQRLSKILPKGGG